MNLLQDEILKGAAIAAVQRREAAEATATPDERIAINHAKAAKANDLRKKEVSNSCAVCLSASYINLTLSKKYNCVLKEIHDFVLCSLIHYVTWFTIYTSFAISTFELHS